MPVSHDAQGNEKHALGDGNDAQCIRNTAQGIGFTPRRSCPGWARVYALGIEKHALGNANYAQGIGNTAQGIRSTPRRAYPGFTSVYALGIEKHALSNGKKQCPGH